MLAIYIYINHIYIYVSYIHMCTIYTHSHHVNAMLYSSYSASQLSHGVGRRAGGQSPGLPGQGARYGHIVASGVEMTSTHSYGKQIIYRIYR